MDPARNGRTISATVALVVTIALAAVTLAMVGMGGGFAKPRLTSSATAPLASPPAPGEG
jgi:hypothetical protein